MRLTEEHRALHALNRLTFGPRPGDQQKVMAMDVDDWRGSECVSRSGRGWSYSELVSFAIILILPQVDLPDFTFSGGTAPHCMVLARTAQPGCGPWALFFSWP
jgi:hypothetical protein